MAEHPLIAAQTQFAFKLFAALAEQAPDTNVVISPISVWLALAMIHTGAAGATRDAIGDALAVGPFDSAELSRAARPAAPAAPDAETTLVIANAIWADTRAGLLDEFARRTGDAFDAEIATLDFSSPAAPGAINQWVAAKTRDKIQKIIRSLHPDELIVIVNAVYFKGTWISAFDEADTHADTFTLPDRRQITVTMMHQQSLLSCFRGPGFQAVRLPYATIGGRRLRMEIFLPDQASSLAEFLGQLNAERWSSWRDHFELMECELTLPRLSINYEHDLAPALATLGMEIAFDSAQADFHSMIAGHFALGRVQHISCFDVNEAGTEAAAATRLLILGDFDEETFSMLVNRPFFCAITDANAGTVLFMGTIVEP